MTDKEWSEFANKCKMTALERKYCDGYDDGYQKGLDDAWEMMKGVCLPPYEGGMELYEVIECFGKGLLKDILRNNSASEAKSKYDEWKAKKEQEEQIHVGDVVVSKNTGNEYLVLSELLNDMVGLLNTSNYVPSILPKNFLTKTGKHYDLPWLQEEHDA